MPSVLSRSSYWASRRARCSWIDGSGPVFASRRRTSSSSRLHRIEHVAGGCTQRARASRLPHRRTSRAGRQHDEEHDGDAKVARALHPGVRLLLAALLEHLPDQARARRHSLGRFVGQVSMGNVQGAELSGRVDARTDRGSLGAAWARQGPNRTAVTGAERYTRNAFAVDERPVRATEVEDLPQLAALPQLEVLAAHDVVVQTIAFVSARPIRTVFAKRRISCCPAPLRVSRSTCRSLGDDAACHRAVGSIVRRVAVTSLGGASSMV